MAEATGAHGQLRLRFEFDGGITRLTEHRQRAPLHVFRPHYLDPNSRGMPYVQILASGGGIGEFDRFDIDLECRSGAAAHVTTQAATRAYRADGEGAARQNVYAIVGAGGFFEYMPAETILFARSHFVQRLRFTVNPSATAIVSDVVVAGRLASGERHQFNLYDSHLEIRDSEGDLLALDVIRLAPAEYLSVPGAVFGEFDIVGTLAIVSQSVEIPKLVRELQDLCGDGDQVLAGASALPNSAGCVVRVLGTEHRFVRDVLKAAWRVARLQLTGSAPPDLRIQ